ncbi:polyphenol oxidase family protein [bacterium]|nr:polyphenol oxidase family protein [bacterium]
MSSEVIKDTQTQPKNQTQGWALPLDWIGVTGGISETSDGSLGWGRAEQDEICRLRTAWALRVGLKPETCITLEQTHSAHVLRVDQSQVGSGFLNPDTRIPDADGIITNDPSVTLITSHADCAPIFLYDPASRAIGLIHSGWRGTLAGIAARAVSLMKDELAVLPSDLRVAIGPMIGTRNYEVGKDVAGDFAGEFGPSVVATFNGRPHLDIFAAIVIDLLRAGVVCARFCQRPPDTYNDRRWSSFRRDGQLAGGMLAYFRIESRDI